MLVHSFSIDGFLHLVEVFEAQGADKVVLRKVVRGKSVEILRSEFTPCATHAGDLLRELARLATQKAESLPDGSREFEDRFTGKRWRISLSECGAPQLFHLTADAPPFLTSLGATGTPFVQVLAEQFAALGREQGFAQKKERNDFRRKLAILEGELVAAKTAAAGRARTEGAPLAMCATFDPSIAGTYEPHARLYIQRGDSVFSLREGLDREGLEWIKLPPLPPIEPAKAGAEEREPAPPALARHDWHTHRGHVSCERCGAPFSEVRNDQACGAQP